MAVTYGPLERGDGIWYRERSETHLYVYVDYMLSV